MCFPLVQQLVVKIAGLLTRQADGKFATISWLLYFKEIINNQAIRVVLLIQKQTLRHLGGCIFKASFWDWLYSEFRRNFCTNLLQITEYIPLNCNSLYTEVADVQYVYILFTETFYYISEWMSQLFLVSPFFFCKTFYFVFLTFTVSDALHPITCDLSISGLQLCRGGLDWVSGRVSSWKGWLGTATGCPKKWWYFCPWKYLKMCGCRLRDMI